MIVRYYNIIHLFLKLIVFYGSIGVRITCLNIILSQTGMLSMQHAPVHELRAYLRAAAVKAHARRPGVTRVANALIAARRGRGGPTAADLAVPDWLSLPSQQHQQHQSSHHHVSSSSVGSKYGKHSSNRSSTGGRVAFPKPPKAPGQFIGTTIIIIIIIWIISSIHSPKLRNSFANNNILIYCSHVTSSTIK